MHENASIVQTLFDLFYSFSIFSLFFAFFSFLLSLSSQFVSPIFFFLVLRAYKIALLPTSNACVLGHFIGPWR